MLAVHCCSSSPHRFLLRRFSALGSLGLAFAFGFYAPSLAPYRILPGTICIWSISLITEKLQYAAALRTEDGKITQMQEVGAFERGTIFVAESLNREESGRDEPDTVHIRFRSMTCGQS